MFNVPCGGPCLDSKLRRVTAYPNFEKNKLSLKHEISSEKINAEGYEINSNMDPRSDYSSALGYIIENGTRGPTLSSSVSFQHIVE